MPQAALTRGAFEVVPGVHRLGDTIPVDGKLSWAPAGPGLFQPLNAYVVIDETSATMIDTGPAALEGQIVSQLEEVVPPALPLSIFLTRAEYAVVGNVGAVHAAHPIEHLFAGGVANIYDAFNEVAGFSDRWQDRTYVDRILPGETISFGAGDRFEVFGSPLRLITSFWVYDRLTQALFSTDVFGYTTLTSLDGPVAIHGIDEDWSTLESVREHLLVRYPWVEHGDTTTIRENFAKVFDNREITAVLPAHGSALIGADLVQRHYDYVQKILSGQRGNS